MPRTSPAAALSAPVVIVGAGLAGLTVALHLAEQPGRRAGQAQPRGGRHRLGAGRHRRRARADDSIESHVRDTQDAGAGLVDEHTARFIAEHSAAAVEWLVASGVPFSPDPAGPLGLHLTREGGHAVRRIAHAADATGKAIHDVLLERVRKHPNIQLRERWMAARPDHLAPPEARETPHCYGVYALDIDQQRVETLPAAAVVMATGGVGKVYRYTSNPDTATGDGIAMAWRAGCRVGQHGVHPVPPDLPVPPAGAQLPHHRGAARRGRLAASCPTARASWRRTTSVSSSRRATSWRARSTSR
jgi:L-aspartate oxidase